MATRRAFLQAGVALGFAGPHRFARETLRRELRIMQWAHPTPGYDDWLAARARRWGEQHDARVTIDHVNSSELAARAHAERSVERGHDLVQLLAPPVAFQEDVVPLDDAVAEVTRRLGRPSAVATGSAYNPRTRHWFAFPEHYVPLVAVRRSDLWDGPPVSWDGILAAAPGLRRRGRPVAIGFSNELDSSTAHVSLLLAHGGRLDRLDAPATVAYLRFAAQLYRRGLPREVIDWSQASNNQLLFAGRAALIANPVSVVAQAERVGLPHPLAASALPVRSAPHMVGCTILWRFSRNRRLAEQWVVDQQLAAHEHYIASGRLNVPAWRTVGTTVAAGHPGPTNGAIQELLEGFLLTSAARHVAQGTATAEEAARRLAAQAAPVFRKWRDAKLI